MADKYLFPESDFADIEAKFQRGEIDNSEREKLLEQQFGGQVGFVWDSIYCLFI